ncbi:TetR family transcriptional regulator [Bdellovibrio bacteriovorus]|uniref:TetR/AcrR family transcriptional regulator n=1 Tax=Bdellovibrio bacteriovorus TaxID=959 RepID=UPI0021D17581|nr:TetR/AcrR family transcriptional regulator [Bdellovibrio bacteriovorus]UXR64551.1 TetR family transcriptional regulator [Bdellovibrio bacteriovorus]
MSETSQLKTTPDEGAESQKGKKRDRSASEERLISAGIEIFSKHGYSGATTKMIAKKADVNESLIGRYFDGKEGLLLSIIERFIEDLRSEELPYSAQENLAAELENYIIFKLSTKDDRDCLGKIIIVQCLTDNKFRKKALERIPMFSDPNLLKRLEVLQNGGKIPKSVDLNDICQDLEAYLHGVFLFDMILAEVPEKEVLARARRFVSRYTQGYRS